MPFIYRPDPFGLVIFTLFIDTVNNHCDIIEEELEGDIDICKIEGEIDSKNRDQIIEMDGVNEDVPKCKMQSVDDVDEVLKKAK